MKRPNTMDVQTLRDEGDGDICAYFSTGHVSIDDFCAEILTEYGDDKDAIYPPSHVYARWVPRPQWGYKSLEMVLSKPGPGAFKVTYTEVAG